MTEPTDTKDPAPSASSVVPIQSPENPDAPMTRAERIFVRINVVQTILAVAGVFTGAVALYAALNESAAVRRQAEAAVWPIVQLYVSDYSNESGAEFQVELHNTGVGPGRMETMRVIINGQAVADWPQAVFAATGRDDIPMSKSFSTGRVIAAGERTSIFAVNDRDAVAKLSALAASGKAQIDYCYCSIFDACWVFESLAQRAGQVALCPDYGQDQFRF